MKVNLVAMTGKDSPKWSPMTETGYIKACKEMGFDAVAITGITLYSLIPAWKAAKKAGLKYIVGATVFICNDPASDVSPYQTMRIYAKDDTGYKALCRILTESQRHFITRNDRTIPTVCIDTVEQYCGKGSEGYDHVVILSGGANGIIQGVMLEDSSAKSRFAEKQEIAGKCKTLLGYMMQMNQDLEEAMAEKARWEAISKKDLAVKERQLDSEMDRLKAMDNPSTSEVEAMLKAFDELSAEKEDFAKAKDMLKDTNTKVKKYQKLYSELQEQCREITGNMDIDNVKALSDYYGDLADELEGIEKTLSGETSVEERMLEKMNTYAEIFGHENLFVEVQDHGTDKEHEYNALVCDMAEHLGLKVVATNNAYRLKKKDSDLMSTVSYKETKKWETPPEEEYLKDDGELLECLLRSIPEKVAREAMENRARIAEMCTVTFDNPERHFPSYDCEELNEEIEAEVAAMLAG